MFEALSYSEFAGRLALSNGAFTDRTRQFVDRHGWELQLDAEGLEIDQFDGEGTTYCVVHDRGRHMGSLRLRSPAQGSMAQAAFGAIWDRHADTLDSALEVTRLCTARDLPEADRRLAFVELLIGLCQYGRRTGTGELFGVVYPGVARAIARVGWQSEILESFETDGRKTLLARWTCSAAAHWALQERSDALLERAQAARRTQVAIAGHAA